MKPRITKMSITPEDCALFEYAATHVAIDDQAGGEYVTITQCVEDEHGANVICINPNEWPAIRAAVNKLIKECRK